MLGKVTKYEMLSCGRVLIPLFGMGVAMSIILKGLFFMAPRIWEPAGMFIESVSTMVSMVLLMALAFAGFVIPVLRYYKSMAAEEGYLTYTLPVKVTTHMAGRLIAGSIWGVAGILVTLVCGIILIPGFFGMASGGASVPVSATLNGETTQLMVALKEIPFDIKANIVGLCLVLLVVSVVSNLLYFHTSIALGTVLMKNRVIGAILGYLLLNAVQSLLSLPLMLLPLSFLGRTNSEFIRFIEGLVVPGNTAGTTRNILGLIWAFMGVIVLITALYAVAHWFITRYCFTKKLNLE